MFREMRRKNQALPLEECVEILKTEKRGTLAVLGDDNYPYALPVNFYYSEAENKIYLHSAREGHKIDAITAHDKVSFTTHTPGEKPADDWAFYVKSVIVFGRAELMIDQPLSREKLRKLGEKYYPTAGELEKVMEKHSHKVQMIAITIEHLSGKLVHEK